MGQYLTIYPRKPVSNTQSATASSSAKTTTKGNTKLYTVQQGDSLWSISKKFPGVTVQNLRTWNDMSSTRLKPGMKIKVSKG